ncbi:MAG: hypothetical protein H0X39_09745 [Actinobacteria bacterium]|nr:hypothetical protein [Actinomycetota bacterium]
MSPTGVWPLLIGVAALAVSIVGTLQRRRDTRREIERRLAVLMDDLGRLNYEIDTLEHHKDAAGEAVPSLLAITANHRRQMLTAEATMLGGKLRNGLSPAQHRTLADNYSRAGRFDRARIPIRRPSSEFVTIP